MRAAMVAAAICAGVALAQPVPDRMSFNARLTDSAGQPLSGNHQMGFGLFAGASGGTAIWTESFSAVNFTNAGVAFIELGGSGLPALSAVLDGSKLYLEVTVDGAVLQPRMAVASVPYALRATAADTAAKLGMLTPAQVQQRVTGVCASGAISGINTDGTVTCQSVATYTAGAGIALGAGTISLSPCAAGEVLRSTGSGYACASANVPVVDFTLTNNLVPDPKMAGSTGWAAGNVPVTQLLPLPEYPSLLTKAYGGYTGYLGNVHVSTESGVGCYQWGLTAQFPIDRTKAYEFSIWIRSEDTTTNNYWGFYAYDNTGTQIAGVWANPYFKTSEGDPNHWVKWTGYVLPSTVPDSNLDGYADTQVGTSSGADWRWPDAAVTAVARFGGCYADGVGSNRSYFALPMVREVVP